MRVNRGFLYGGVFLVAIGGVIVAVEAGLVDTARLTDALRLWPLAVVAIGAAIVLRRSELGLPTGVLAAAIPGLVLGGALAVAPRVATDCGVRGQSPSIATEQGSFGGPATVSLTGGCGTFTVRTSPGDEWQLTASNTAGRLPRIRSSAQSLSVETTGHEGSDFFDGGRDDWDVTLPASAMDAMSLEVLAGEGDVGLAGARIDRLTVTANASDIVVDATDAVVANLTGVVNVGSLSIRLPADGDLDGSLRIGAGELQVCTPPGVGLRLTTRGAANEVSVRGLDQNGTVWESPDYALAGRHADLRVNVNFGTVEIDPIGGCR